MHHPSDYQPPPHSTWDASLVQPPSFSARLAHALFMFDAYVGLGNAVMALFVLTGLGLIFIYALPKFARQPFTEADQAALDRQLEWPLVIDETFDDGRLDPNADWGLGYEYGDTVDIYREMFDGEYLWTADFWTTECCEETSWLVTTQPVTNFRLSADFTKYAGGEGPTYGVIFHYLDPDNYYSLTFNDIGNLSVEGVYQAEWGVVFTTLWPTKIIRPFEPNHLLLTYEDGRGFILINGYYMGQFTDARIPSGHIGFVVESPYQRADTVIVGIDNVRLRVPN